LGKIRVVKGKETIQQDFPTKKGLDTKEKEM